MDVKERRSAKLAKSMGSTTERCCFCFYSHSFPAMGKMVGQGRLELPTSRLSVVRSNQLSYKPAR
jgi:hypothetical protein